MSALAQAAASVVNERFFAARPAPIKLSRPGSKIGALPPLSLVIAAMSKSRPVTRKCFAQHAAVTQPRCQRPRTVMFIRFRFSPLPRFVHPLICLQPFECAHDALFNRQLGRPPRRTNFLGVEEDE